MGVGLREQAGCAAAGHPEPIRSDGRPGAGQRDPPRLFLRARRNLQPSLRQRKIHIELLRRSHPRHSRCKRPSLHRHDNHGRLRLHAFCNPRKKRVVLGVQHTTLILQARHIFEQRRVQFHGNPRTILPPTTAPRNQHHLRLTFLRNLRHGRRPNFRVVLRQLSRVPDQHLVRNQRRRTSHRRDTTPQHQRRHIAATQSTRRRRQLVRALAQLPIRMFRNK